MSTYFVMEIQAIQYKYNSKSNNIDEVKKFVKNIVGDMYYIAQSGTSIDLLRTCDNSLVLGWCSTLYPNYYLTYNNFAKQFSTVKDKDFYYSPKEEYIIKNYKKISKEKEGKDSEAVKENPTSKSSKSKLKSKNKM